MLEQAVKQQLLIIFIKYVNPNRDIELRDIERTFDKHNLGIYSDTHSFLDEVNLLSPDELKIKFNEIVNRNYKVGENVTRGFLKELMVSLISDNKSVDIYDPALGSANLFIEANNKLSINNFYGEETDSFIYELAKMNSLVNGIKESKINYSNTNSITNSSMLDKKFDVIISEPPYHIDLMKELDNEPRFNEIKGENPRAQTDFSFIFHSLSLLKDDGEYITTANPSLIFRDSHKNIRKILVDQLNVIDTIIKLPNKIHENTRNPIYFLVFKKNRENNGKIYFMNFSNKEIKGHITEVSGTELKEFKEKFISAYKNKEIVDGLTRFVSRKEIKENDYNLNIHRYIDDFEIDPRKPTDELIEEINSYQEEIFMLDRAIDFSFFKKTNNKNK